MAEIPARNDPNPERSPPLGARELAALALFALALVGASAVPYAVAWRATPEGRVYVGTPEASADDYPTYLAKMRSAARGHWLYTSPYAPELESTLHVRPLYATLGALTQALGRPLWLGFHAGRLLLGAVCLLSIFAIAYAIARSRRERWTAFVLATLGAGFGFFSGRAGARASWSYDLWVPELNATHGLLTNPHFPLAIALALATFAGVARTLETGRRAPALFAGLALGALTLVHTYDDLIVAGALLLFGAGALATRAIPLRRLARTALLLGATALPAVAWQLAAFASDPSVGQMLRAQPVGSPVAVATGLGLLAPLGLLGAPRLARRSPLGGIVVAWILVVPVLLVLPLPFARRMVAGWHVALGLAAGIGLAALVARVPGRALRGALLAGIVGVACLTSIDHFVYQTRRFQEPTPGILASLPRDLLDAYAWLDAHASPGDVVLAAYGPSNWLPVFTDLRPYFGHWAETPDARARARRVQLFFARATRDTAREALLRDAGIRWVLDGPVGQLPGAARIRPDRLEAVSAAATVGRVSILRVDQGDRTR